MPVYIEFNLAEGTSSVWYDSSLEPKVQRFELSGQARELHWGWRKSSAGAVAHRDA